LLRLLLESLRVRRELLLRSRLLLRLLLDLLLLRLLSLLLWKLHRWHVAQRRRRSVQLLQVLLRLLHLRGKWLLSLHLLLHLLRELSLWLVLSGGLFIASRHWLPRPLSSRLLLHRVSHLLGLPSR
jgi:hypothetical protein